MQTTPYEQDANPQASSISRFQVSASVGLRRLKRFQALNVFGGIFGGHAAS